MGIGDLVMFTPYIEAISKKYNAPVSIMVKKNTKASSFLKNSKFIKEIIYLERDEANKKHSGITGLFHLVKDLKVKNFDKIFIFNSSLRYFIVAKLSNIKNIYQYPLLKKKNQNIIEAAKELIFNTLGQNVNSTPKIQIDQNQVEKTKIKYFINNKINNIVLGTGGSGETKRVPAYIFLKFIRKIIEKYESRFFIVTGNSPGEIKILNEIINSDLKEYCTPLNDLSIDDILPIIANCKIAVCNDTGFSHLSAAIGLKTIVLMADTPLIYGSYSSNMYPILPQGEKNVSHNTLGKDKLDPNEIFLKVVNLLG
tara:strand:+ start:5398 stop:6330 length:933 start_codon:yes stop_codon:yes gene_type:complete